MEDLYGGDAPAEKPGGGDMGEGEGKEGGEDTTALLPKSILMGKKFDVGDEVVLRITGIHENEISVAYAEEPKKEEGGEKEGMAEAPMPGGNPGGADGGLYS